MKIKSKRWKQKKECENKKNSILKIHSWNRFLIPNIENLKTSRNGFVQNPILICSIRDTFYHFLLNVNHITVSEIFRLTCALRRFTSHSIDSSVGKSFATSANLFGIPEFFHFLLVRRSYVIKHHVRPTWSSRFSSCFPDCTDRRTTP